MIRTRRRILERAVVLFAAVEAAIHHPSRAAVMNARNPSVSLRASVLPKPDMRLDVAYTLRNESDSPIYVFDRPTRFESGGIVVVEPDRMFVLLDKDGAVRLLHVLMPTPTIRAVRQRPPVYVSRVDAHAAHTRRLTLPLPLRENQQFFSADPDATEPRVTVDKVRVVVGWVEERPGLQVARVETPAGAELNLYGGWGLPAQRLSMVDSTVPSIVVVEHLPPFERYPRLED